MHYNTYCFSNKPRSAISEKSLGLQNNLQTLLPNPTVRSIERVNIGGAERKRARPRKSAVEKSTWAWGDESADHT